MFEDVKVGDVLVWFGAVNNRQEINPIDYCKVMGITKTLIKTDTKGNFRRSDGFSPGEYSIWSGRTRVEKLCDANIEHVKEYRKARDVIRLRRQITETDLSSLKKNQLESIVAIIKDVIESNKKEGVNEQSN